MTESPAHLIALSIAAFAGGAALGAVYFAWLWRAAHRLGSGRRPGLWLLGGMFLRLAFALGVLYVLTEGVLFRLVPGLLGFLVARTVAIRRLRPVPPATVRKPATPH